MGERPFAVAAARAEGGPEQAVGVEEEAQGRRTAEEAVGAPRRVGEPRHRRRQQRRHVALGHLAGRGEFLIVKTSVKNLLRIN